MCVLVALAVNDLYTPLLERAMERDVSSSLFCPRCGKKVTAEEDYCLDCGQMLIDIPPEELKIMKAKRHSMIRLNWSIVFLGVFSVLSIIGAIASFLMTDVSGNFVTMMLGSDLPTALNEMNLSQEQYLSALRIEGVLSIITSIFAIISLVCCFKRNHFTVALAACIAASLGIFVEFFFINEKMIMSVLTATIIQAIIGIVIAVMIYKSRDQFKEENFATTA